MVISFQILNTCMFSTSIAVIRLLATLTTLSLRRTPSFPGKGHSVSNFCRLCVLHVLIFDKLELTRSNVAFSFFDDKWKVYISPVQRDSQRGNSIFHLQCWALLVIMPNFLQIFVSDIYFFHTGRVAFFVVNTVWVHRSLHSGDELGIPLGF